jgi:DNA-directed RNA polymerase subunit E"
MPRRKVKRKVCLKCKAILPIDAQKCPYCGSTQFTEDFEGILIIINPEKSEVAKVAGINKKGHFAVKIL